MKKKRFFNHITIIFFVLGFSVNAQQIYVPIEGLFNSNGVLQITETAERYSVPLSSMKGSPYLSKNFLPGRIKNNTGYTKTHLIRYNIHRDVMEIKINEDEYQELKRNPEFEIRLNNKNFKYYRSLDGSRIIESGYFQVLEKGVKIDLLLKHETEFIPAKKIATAYGQPEPPEFKKDKKYYFYFHDDKKLERIDRLKEKKILKILLNYKFDPRDFLKEKDLSLKKPEEVIELLKYLNEKG